LFRPDIRDGNVLTELRPAALVLIVSPDAFNRVIKAPVVVPITRGGGSVRAADSAVTLEGAGRETTAVDIRRARSISPRAAEKRGAGETAADL
jgi:mRNA-degrading endonuclease toxin of MazEF toxin-antitoxin module